MSRVSRVARRTFLVGAVAVTGGLAVGYWWYRKPYANPLLDDAPPGSAVLTPYVRIDNHGVTIITPRAEMGQGVHTTLAALVAEELDLALDQVRVEHGPASYAYYNAALLEEGIPFPPTDTSWLAERMRDATAVPAKFLALQVTGGSTSVVDAYQKMRLAGATARAALLQAAAAQLGTDATTLRTANGGVIAPHGTELRYTELAPAAARLSLPDDPPLKDPAQWKLLGQSLPRVDMRAKVTGSAPFGIDTRDDGMLYATVRMNPHRGGLMRSFDASKAESMRGVRRVLALDGAVAVVATNTWYAMQAARVIAVDWAPADYPASTADIQAAIESGFDDANQDSRQRDDGDVSAALKQADVIQASYHAPFVAHATLEPMNATARLANDRLDIWAGTQNPTMARTTAARVCGLDESRVHVHTPYLGGGFGRRGEVDYVAQAAAIAQAMPGTTIKTTWSREEDMRHDMYRPMASARIQAVIADKRVHALDVRVSCASTLASQMERFDMPFAGPDSTIVQGAWEQPYRIDHYRVTGYRAPETLPVGFWRSVGASQNGFFHESFMDELAVAAGTDPLALRLDLVEHPVSRKVIETAAEMAGWGNKLPPGQAMGFAFVLSFGVPVAQVVRVALRNNRIAIEHVYAAADVGVLLDPRNAEAQLQSGINFGLSAAIAGEITVSEGRVEQSNFHDFPVLRLNQAPEISVRVLSGGTRIRGIGEPGTPPAAPALANAIFALTGKRLRAMPFNKHVEFA